jgi:hypothetical protein
MVARGYDRGNCFELVLAMPAIEAIARFRRSRRFYYLFLSESESCLALASGKCC